MAVWLLKWNPSKWEWDNYEEYCERASNEHPLACNWECYSRNARAGDEVYLVRLGKDPRGIIAHGTVTKAGETADYVSLEWDTILNYKTQDILDWFVLEERLPQQDWDNWSGISIKDEVLPVLRELWAATTRRSPENPEESVYEEGAKKTVYTTKYERDPRIRWAFLKGKHLKCEVCGFDFEEAYGELGAGYIEVHHKKPVSEGVRITDLNKDLVMLCSNCHTMIHRGKAHMITVEELKRIIAEAKIQTQK